MKKILELLRLPETATEADALKAIAALQSNQAKTVTVTEFEKKVLARMAAGKISREAATLAQKHQEETDKLIARRDKSAKK